MLSEDLQIYKDCYNLCKALLMYQPQISKTIRYGEFSVAVQYACSALDTIYLANRDISGRGEKIAEVQRLVGGIRSRVRLFGETKFITVRQATSLMFLVDKVAKQATAWRNATERKVRAVKP